MGLDVTATNADTLAYATHAFLIRYACIPHRRGVCGARRDCDECGERQAGGAGAADGCGTSKAVVKQ